MRHLWNPIPYNNLGMVASEFKKVYLCTAKKPISMSHSILRIAFVCVLVTFFLTTDAQLPEHPNAFGVRYLFLDHITPNIADRAETQQWSSGIEVNYTRNLGIKYLNVVLPAKLAVAKFPEAKQDVRFASADLLLQGILFNHEKLLSPYVFAGGGIVFEDYKESNIQFPLGLGCHTKIAPPLYFNVQVEYRISMLEGRDNMQFGIGLMYVPGLGKEELPLDTDGDGIPDFEDRCPLEAGLVGLKGCPDRDDDGIADINDDCPDVAGSMETKGCPDRDGDGVPDKDDRCPDLAGLAEFQGCPDDVDSDGDGISDNKDDCPDEIGLPEWNGCPDSDGDGIPDKKDECPDEVGTIATNGCPDKDGDGIPDKSDDCPDLAGIAQFNGCPDSDNDGIPDHLDRCPKVPGIAELSGCPAEKDTDGDGFPDSVDDCPDIPGKFDGCPDKDGDGIPDQKDRCPDSAGPASNDGCPVMTVEDRAILDFAMRKVQFETGSSTLTVESYTTLDKVAEIMVKYPDYYLIINGHTDNVGRAQTNLNLSDQRAKACFNFLVSRGVSAARMLASGFGDTKPITSNRTEEGRALNRRVEFIVYLK